MVAIHQFLLVVATPILPEPVDIIDSLNEIIRVVRDEVALMLVRDGHMIGTMGLINPKLWYSKRTFITDRWHFCLPEVYNTPQAELLEDEAIKIAELAGVKFIHSGRIRKGKKGVLRVMPRIYGGESDTMQGQGA